MAEELLEENRHEDGSASGDDDSNSSVMTLEEVSIDFIKNLVVAIKSTDSAVELDAIRKSAASFQSLQLAISSILLDEILDPSPKTFIVKLKQVSVGEEDSFQELRIQARTRIEAIEMMNEHTKKNLTMSKRLEVLDITEVVGGVG